MSVFSSLAPLPSATIPQAASGDDAAFATLVSRFKPTVYKWAVSLSGDEDEAEDITQEVFVRVHRKLSAFRGDGPFDAWLYRITRRVVSRSRRRSSKHVAIAEAPDGIYVTDPGARVDRTRAMELIREISAALPMRQREIFVLCDLEGRTPAEVATLTGMKDSTVRANLFKARASIRQTLLGNHPHFAERKT